MTNRYVIFTKPLQFFNAFNIPEVDENSIFLMTNSFFQADLFFQKILNQTSIKCFFFEEARDPYLWLEKNALDGDFLYINTDYGVKPMLWMWNLRSLNIFVYEEGIGTYRTDLISRSFLVKMCLKILGFKSYFGGGRFTKGIFVYDIDKYLSTKDNLKIEVRNFEMNFFDHLKNFKFRNLLFDVKINFINDINNKDVLLYISSWSLYPNLDVVLSEYVNYITVFKPHPHIVNSLDNLFDLFQYQIDGNIMVEYLILNILENAKSLVVLHENSSSMLYFSNDSRIKSIILN